MINRIFSLILCSLLLTIIGCFKLSQPDKPNILFIFADDQCFETLGMLGSEVQTPNLDRLAANGILFTEAFNMGAWHGAVCVASRTMLNTGRFLWQARDLEPNLSAVAGNRQFWSQQLEDAGYETYFSGKWHVNYDVSRIFQNSRNLRPGMPNQTPQGYNRPVEGQPDLWHPWDTQNEGYWKGGKHWSEVLADDGEDFIQQAAKSDKPFFMYLAFNAPHDPRQSPREYVEKYPLEKIKLPENFIGEYPWNEAMGSGRDLRDERLAPFPRTAYAVKVHRQEYYAIISHMDYQIGRILQMLKSTGLDKNTYVFFTADHGLAVGRHGLMGKQNMFEHSLRVPFIISGPRMPVGKKIDIPVYLQDVMPTTLALAGIEIPAYVQFKNLLPLTDGESEEHYKAIYGGYRNHQRMVRKQHYKLIHYPQAEKTLLFDLKQDPLEMTDISELAVNRGILDELKNELKTLQKDAGDTLALNF